MKILPRWKSCSNNPLNNHALLIIWKDLDSVISSIKLTLTPRFDKDVKFIRQCWPAFFVLPFTLFVIMIPVVGFAQTPGESADFLIVEKSANLRIYNRFEQQISYADQAKMFLPFQPLRVIAKDAFLSDKFTPCLKIRRARDIYYIIKADSEMLENSAQLGEQTFVENAVVLNDTVEVLRDQRLFVAQIADGTKIPDALKNFLAKGTLVQQAFRKKNRVFIAVLGDPATYGWSNIFRQQENRLWRRFRHAKPVDELPEVDSFPGVLHETRQKIAEVNELFARLFGYFNQKTGMQKSAPQWDVIAENREIRCKLRNLPDSGSDASPFAESTRYLLLALENIALRGGCEVINSATEIIVRER